VGEEKPFKVRTGGESAKRYSGVVLVVMLFVRSEGWEEKMTRINGISKTRRKTRRSET